MNGNDTSTLRASPLLSFFQQKALCAGSLDPQSIFDQAGLVAQAVAFVHLLDRLAGKR